MQVKASGRFKNALNFVDPLRHADDVSEQSPIAEDGPQTFQQFDGLLGVPAFIAGDDFLKTGQRQFIPRPGVDERLRLRLVVLADVVIDLEIIALAIERRVDIAEVDRVILDLAAQDVQVVAVIQDVSHLTPRTAPDTRCDWAFLANPLYASNPQVSSIVRDEFFPSQQLRGLRLHCSPCYTHRVFHLRKCPDPLLRY